VLLLSFINIFCLSVNNLCVFHFQFIMPRGGKRGKKSLSSRKRPRVDVDTEENYEGESTHSDCDENRGIELYRVTSW
jgi:hypothetical protein